MTWTRWPDLAKVNGDLGRVAGLLKQWLAKQRGEAVYRGPLSMPDGSKALLLERGNQMLAKPADTALLQQRARHRFF